MTPKEILAKAIARIENPEHWCQSAFARDKYGNSINYNSPAAVSWCATGAILKECPIPSDYEPVLDLINNTHFEVRMGVSAYNDTYIHSKVLDYLRKAL